MGWRGIVSGRWRESVGERESVGGSVVEYLHKPLMVGNIYVWHAR